MYIHIHVYVHAYFKANNNIYNVHVHALYNVKTHKVPWNRLSYIKHMILRTRNRKKENKD